MRKKLNNLLRTAAPLALAVFANGGAKADLLSEDVLVGTSGDGLIFADPSEGVLEPGIKSVTFTRTRVPDGMGGFTYVDPFEEIITDLSGLAHRGDVTNCLMANKANVFCDSEGGSGKRIKVQLTGRNPFDIRLRTVPSATYPSVDYFTFGKVTNKAGARMTGFALQMLDSTGRPMGELNPANAVLFNLGATGIGIGSRLPDGLFGAGGQEGEIGFFSTDRASLARTSSADTLLFGALSNAEYVANFGTAFLDQTLLPDGLFWDDNSDPSDEAALVAWNNLAAGGWTYGNLALNANLNAKLQELAADLGVSVAELQYAPGALVPANVVAAAEANGLFSTGLIEDLANSNLNFTITVGSVEAGQFVWRIVPTFAPIVEGTETDYQFRVAGNLDAVANVPFLDIGNASEYRAAIDQILALDSSERGRAIESIGYSFAPAYVSLGFEAARNQINLITDTAPWQNSQDGDMVTQGGGSWKFDDGLYGLIDLGGVRAEYDPTTGSVGYEIDLKSLSLGLEKRINLNTSLGVMVSASNGSADANGGLGSIDVDAYSIAGFVRSNFTNGTQVQAVLGFQDLSYDSERAVLGRQASASPDGSQWFAALRADHLFDLKPALRFGPTASLGYYDVSVDGFSESNAGAFNLAVGDQDVGTFLGSIGVRGEYGLPSAGNGSRLTGSLQYAFVNETGVGTAVGFVGLPGYDVPGLALDDQWVDVMLGFEADVSSSGDVQTTLRAGYSGAFGSDYESHGLNLGLNVLF